MLRLMVAIALLPALLAHADIYRWVDENGKIHLSDDPPPEKMDAEQLDVEVNTYEAIDYSKIQYYQREEKPTRKRVVMFATDWCGYCARARKYFRAKGIPYKEYDIDKNKAARIRFDSYGKGGVPLILIGKQKMRGFTAKRFERLYFAEQERVQE